MPGMLSDLPHEQLYMMRAREPDRMMQGMLALPEHRAFAREWVQENPIVAAPSLLFATPAYQLAKLLGLQRARTPASLDELFAGYHGLAEGMLSSSVPSAYAHHEQSETVRRPDGKWINVYGRETPRAGGMLPGSGVYDTMEDAVRAARSRSANTRMNVRGDMPQRPAQPPVRRTPSDSVRG